MANLLKKYQTLLFYVMLYNKDIHPINIRQFILKYMMACSKQKGIYLIRYIKYIAFLIFNLTFLKFKFCKLLNKLLNLANISFCNQSSPGYYKSCF